MFILCLMLSKYPVVSLCRYVVMPLCRCTVDCFKQTWLERRTL